LTKIVEKKKTKLNEITEKSKLHNCEVTKKILQVNTYEQNFFNDYKLQIFFDFKTPIVLPTGSYISQNDFCNSGKRAITTFGVIVRENLNTYKYIYIQEVQFANSSWELVQNELFHILTLENWNT
jgi:hypothetical protein